MGIGLDYARPLRESLYYVFQYVICCIRLGLAVANVFI